LVGAALSRESIARECAPAEYHISFASRRLKNTHLLRYAHPSSLPGCARPSQRTRKYASFLRISRALHLDVFEQPDKNCFFNNLLEPGNIKSGKGIDISWI
jgi:hypothetical protein